MNDLISKAQTVKAIINAIDRTPLYENSRDFCIALNDGMSKAIKIVNCQPTINAQPVVRCGECEYWNCATTECLYHYLELPCGDDYCSKGEKMEL